MQTKPLEDNLKKYLVRHNLKKKFDKQLAIFLTNPFYPSLRTERLEPKDRKVYYFRIDRRYRAIFVLTKPDEIEIIDINLHYE